MLLRLFLLFTLFPILEILILMQISALLGPLTAIILVIGTGFAGASLAKIQGFQTVQRIRENMKQGIMPGDEVFDAFLIFVAGVLLITPGLISDVSGIILLMPKIRASVKRFLVQAIDKRIKNGTLRFRRS
ncbi:MAG: FxsA family protein [Desulfobacteraceae bacterium]|jgi:UPF0716 protein FxsA